LVSKESIRTIEINIKSTCCLDCCELLFETGSSTGGSWVEVIGINSRKPDGDLLQYLQIFGKSKFFGPKRPKLRSKGQQCSVLSETQVKTYGTYSSWNETLWKQFVPTASLVK